MRASSRQRENHFCAGDYMAARHYAHLALLEAATEHHIGAFRVALQAGNKALEAARLAQEPMAECRCHVRLADIYKARGRFRDAEYHYGEALRILRDWRPTSAAQQRWAIHWRARVNRKQGSLYLFRGEPDRALSLLEASIATFTELKSEYELARASYALGWAYSHLGQWDAATAQYAQGLELTRKLADRRGHLDPRQMLEGLLCLATAHWQCGRVEKAACFLYKAQPFIDGEQSSRWGGQTYHEVSRYHLLRGRILLAKGGPENIQAARDAFQAGIDFHQTEERQDPGRLASLYNATGMLELVAQDRQRELDPEALHNAVEQFAEALRWANASDPPNRYYVADVSVNACAAALQLEEVPERRLNLLRETQARCLEGPFWRQLARLELLWANECARAQDTAGLTAHGAQAIAYGMRFNRDVVDQEIIPRVEAIIDDLSIPVEQRPALLEATGRHLEALADRGDDRQARQVAEIKERLLS
ncbi:MAG TPA: tetratricopeptide repeat protein [Solirubrobacteraceae bacterium]|nr:tetratricopeptide repeat protein [Solirubrobacteraceae bacterium]